MLNNSLPSKHTQNYKLTNPPQRRTQIQPSQGDSAHLQLLQVEVLGPAPGALGLLQPPLHVPVGLLHTARVTKGRQRKGFGHLTFTNTSRSLRSALFSLLNFSLSLLSSSCSRAWRIRGVDQDNRVVMIKTICK